MEIIGKVFQIMDKEKGKSARGDWSKQQFVIETKDEFPRKVCIMSWNDKVDLDTISKGDDVKVSVNVESREFNGKWYTDVKAWKLEILGQEGRSSSGNSDSSQDLPTIQDSANLDEEPPEDGSDDLPF